MPSDALFDPDRYRELPLWAQVLLASRMTRRALLWMPASVPVSTRERLTAGCDALDRCAEAGSRSRADRQVIEKAAATQASVDSHGAATAMYYAADSAHAAEDSLDFSAAESACSGSAGKAITAAMGSRGLNPLQARIFLASDVDLLAFACKEAGVGRYDGLGTGVMQRLTPIYPPSERDLNAAPPQREHDNTHGAR